MMSSGLAYSCSPKTKTDPDTRISAWIAGVGVIALYAVMFTFG